jgi:hypothetical protein
MGFEIEEITKNVKASFKKNPAIWVLGAGAVVIGGYFMMRQGGGGGYLTEAYPKQPLYPDEIGSGPGDVGAGLSDLALLDLLTQMDERRAEDLNALAAQQQDFLQSLHSAFTQYMQQPQPSYYQQPQPSYYQQPQTAAMGYDAELMRQAEYVYGTPNLIFSERGVGYTQEQVGTMYDWAVEENAAISRGFAGTSTLPSSLAGSDLIVTYYPGGQVAFTPRGEDRPATPAPTAWQREVERRGQEAAT